MKPMTIKQLTKKVLAILKANNSNPRCVLVQCNMFTHSDGSHTFDFSINADKIFLGRSPDECLAKLEASFIPEFEGDISL